MVTVTKRQCEEMDLVIEEYMRSAGTPLATEQQITAALAADFVAYADVDAEAFLEEGR